MFVYGIHPVEILLEESPESVQELYCTEPDDSKKYGEIRQFAEKLGFSLQRKRSSSLDGMVEGSNHQGVVAKTSEFSYLHLDDLLDMTAGQDRACVVILDQVQDPRNLGAILRSTAAFGIDGAVIPKDRSASVTGTVVKTSVGQAYNVPVAKVTNITRTLNELKDTGWWTVGTFKDEERAIDEIDYDMKTGLVIGGESEGIRRLVGETCDFRATIPISPGVESLNASVASAVAMYEINRQLRQLNE